MTENGYVPWSHQLYLWLRIVQPLNFLEHSLQRRQPEYTWCRQVLKIVQIHVIIVVSSTLLCVFPSKELDALFMLIVNIFNWFLWCCFEIYPISTTLMVFNICRDLDILADCGADNRICILDLRQPNSCTLTIESDHITGVNVVEWCPSQDFFLLSAIKDPEILLYEGCMVPAPPFFA